MPEKLKGIDTNKQKKMGEIPFDVAERIYELLEKEHEKNRRTFYDKKDR